MELGLKLPPCPFRPGIICSSSAGEYDPRLILSLSKLDPMKNTACLMLALLLTLAGCEVETPAANPAITAIDEFISSGNIDKTQPEWRKNLAQPPKIDFDPKHKYYWILQTGKGRMKIELMPAIAPMHVSSTIYLARLGFYDGLKFHRIIPGFMAQGGCPSGTGRDGPGYKYSGEFHPAVKHTTLGNLSMANSGPGTDGSQFFLTFAPTPWLDEKHTLFGKLVEGFQVLTLLQNTGTKDGTPTEETLIVKSSIETK